MRQRLGDIVSKHRWPLFVAGLLSMSVIAQGTLVYVATRPGAPRPIANYYQRSLRWDADAAVLDASRTLGWRLHIDVPHGPELAFAELRPIDIMIHDESGQPVQGLVGRVMTTRAADADVGGESALVALAAPGRYRTLAHLPLAGRWQLALDAELGRTRFVHRAAIEVLAGGAP